MFDFFKRKKVSIDSISFPTFDWNLTEQTARSRTWMNPKQFCGLGVDFFNVPPDIPTLKDIDQLRRFYRALAGGAKGGLIEVSVIDLNGFQAVKTVFKFPPSSQGMNYVGSLTIPFQDYSYVLRIHAIEVGVTGGRDSVVLMKMMTLKEIEFEGNAMHGWWADPYAPDHKAECLMNLSEQEIYDKDFPDHPLSLVRGKLHELEAGIRFGPELNQLRPFR